MKFKYPFEGKKKPLKLVSLFLYEPEWMFKIEGTSFSGLWAYGGYESQYKGMKNCLKRGNSKKTEKFFKKHISQILFIPTELKQAINGAQLAIEKYSNLGSYEAFYNGVYNEVESEMWSYKARFMVEIEREFKQFAKLLSLDEKVKETEWIKNSKIRNIMISSERPIEIGSYDENTRKKIALEVMLAYLAAFDAEKCAELGFEQSILNKIFPENDGYKNNFTSLLFDWVTIRLNTNTVAEFLGKTEKCFEKGLEQKSVYRWKNGDNFPKYEHFEKVFKTLLPEVNKIEYETMFYGAKMLNLIGYLAEQTSKDNNKESPLSENIKDSLLPFGYSTFSCWLENRYAFWFEFHMKR